MIVFIVSLNLLSCNDNNIINIYNKYTEQYRSGGVEKENPDTCITVKVLGFKTGEPLANARIVITMPKNDTVARNTGKDGFAVFPFARINEGTYLVEASVIHNGVKYSRKNSFYLYEKNNKTLTIYIQEDN